MIYPIEWARTQRERIPTATGTEVIETPPEVPGVVDLTAYREKRARARLVVLTDSDRPGAA